MLLALAQFKYKDLPTLLPCGQLGPLGPHYGGNYVLPNTHIQVLKFICYAHSLIDNIRQISEIEPIEIIYIYRVLY